MPGWDQCHLSEGLDTGQFRGNDVHKGFFQQQRAFPQSDLNLLFLFTGQVLAATQTFSLCFCFTRSNNVHLVRHTALQGGNMALMGRT